MKKIDWPELLNLYNCALNTNYSSSRTMLQNGYKRFKSLKKFSFKLGISKETLRQKLIKEGIKINPPIRPRNKKDKLLKLT